MNILERTYQYERGVRYSHRELHIHDWCFVYMRKHVETGTTYEVKVWIDASTGDSAERDFYKLLDYWNRDERWRYWAKL